MGPWLAGLALAATAVAVASGALDSPTGGAANERGASPSGPDSASSFPAGWTRLPPPPKVLGGPIEPAAADSLRTKLQRLEQRPARGLRASGAVTIGRSAEGRPIEVEEYGHGDQASPVLVFGCIHGTECAASAIRHIGSDGRQSGRPIFVVPNLNPDGFAAGTRLNGRGVDLNRNFSAGWEPMYSRGDPQYSGPHPFSEPETRLAARLIRTLQPDVTIWFHQEADPLVRAWGPSIRAARRYARLVELPFVRLPWLAGTAPNWQNHRFPGTSSFVVELPPGAMTKEVQAQHALAIASLGRWMAGEIPDSAQGPERPASP